MDCCPSFKPLHCNIYCIYDYSPACFLFNLFIFHRFFRPSLISSPTNSSNIRLPHVDYIFHNTNNWWRPFRIFLHKWLRFNGSQIRLLKHSLLVGLISKLIQITIPIDFVGYSTSEPSAYSWLATRISSAELSTCVCRPLWSSLEQAPGSIVSAPFFHLIQNFEKK